MSDIEGAICDECGARIGPNGCCADAKAKQGCEKNLTGVCYEFLELCKELAERIEDCPDCEGSGLAHPDDACARCGGQGVILENATGLISDLRDVIADGETALGKRKRQ